MSGASASPSVAALVSCNPMHVKKIVVKLAETSEGKEIVAELAETSESKEGGAKVVRCGKCTACALNNCQTCRCCLDMIRYGGPGALPPPHPPSREWFWMVTQ